MHAYPFYSLTHMHAQVGSEPTELAEKVDNLQKLCFELSMERDRCGYMIGEESFNNLECMNACHTLP